MFHVLNWREIELVLDWHCATIVQFIDLFGTVLFPDRYRHELELVAGEVDVTTIWFNCDTDKIDLEWDSMHTKCLMGIGLACNCLACFLTVESGRFNTTSFSTSFHLITL